MTGTAEGQVLILLPVLGVTSDIDMMPGHFKAAFYGKAATQVLVFWLLAACSLILPVTALIAGQQDEAIVLDLLENGRLVLHEEVAAVLPVEESVRQIRRIGLEKDGHKIRAAFRDKSVRIDSRERGAGKYYDAYYNEVAAFVISRYLGLNIVPPTVLRSIPISTKGLQHSDKTVEGSLQLWIENSVVAYDLPEEKRDYPGDPIRRNQQLKEIRIFDCIIGNVDRHQGNFLVDFNPRYPSGSYAIPYLGKLWAIDHTKAFHSSRRVSSKHCQLSKITREPVSQVFMQRLRGWQLTQVEQALRASGLSDTQLDRLNLKALDQRARKVRDHIDSLQRDSGLDDKAFYSSGAWHKVW